MYEFIYLQVMNNYMLLDQINGNHFW